MYNTAMQIAKNRLGRRAIKPCAKEAKKVLGLKLRPARKRE